MLRLRGGVGSFTSPEYLGYEAIELTEAGLIPIEDTKRVVIDLTEAVTVLKRRIPKQVFVELLVDPSAESNATITSADFFYSPKGDGKYIKYSYSNQVVTVEPGSTGYAAVEIKK